MSHPEQKQSLDPIVGQGPIVESSDDAIIAVSLEGIVLSWNQAAERIRGGRAKWASKVVLGSKLYRYGLTRVSSGSRRGHERVFDYTPTRPGQDLF